MLAFDFGLRQIGVAVGNRLTATAQPLTTLRARDGIPDWSELQQLLEEWQPEMVVVGLPLNMDDSPGELSRLAEKFGRRLEGRFQVSVEFVDERLSSYEAKQQMREAGHKGDFKKQPADGIAAQLILETYLAS